jgi:hypothetical protein
MICDLDPVVCLHVAWNENRSNFLSSSNYPLVLTYSVIILLYKLPPFYAFPEIYQANKMCHWHKQLSLRYGSPVLCGSVPPRRPGQHIACGQVDAGSTRSVLRIEICSYVRIKTSIRVEILTWGGCQDGGLGCHGRS